MADKSPHKPSGKKPGKTLKEKRAAKRRKRSTGSSVVDPTDRPRP
jgi:hypothetical protein